VRGVRVCVRACVRARYRFVTHVLAAASLLQDSGVGNEEQQSLALASQTKQLSGGYIALIVIVCVLVLAAIGVMLFCFLRSRGFIGGSSRDDASTGTETVVNNTYYDPNAKQDRSDTFLSARDASPTSQRANTMPTGTMSAFDTTQLVRPGGNNNGTIGSFTTASAFDLPSPGVGYPARSMTSVGGTMGGTMGQQQRSMTSVEAPGTFVCTVCQKVYQYKTDLDTHRQLRHP
jgi:hypothetical protein